MKKGNVYRFSLQFSADTEPGICAGELLERLGNKKSALVVKALNEFIQRNPRILDESLRIKVEEQSSLSRKRLEQTIREIVPEQLSRNSSSVTGSHTVDTDNLQEDDISQMLNNLDLFE